MSLPKIQYQLTGRPRLLAGSTWFFLNARPISHALAGAVSARALSSVIDPAAELRIGLNCELSMSAGNASLGHACVSPAGPEDHSTPDLETCASTNLGHLIQGAVA